MPVAVCGDMPQPSFFYPYSNQHDRALLTFEKQLFAGTTSAETWLQHAQGIATLMEQRGPAAHAQGNDAAILFSFRGILVGIPPLPTLFSSTPMSLVMAMVFVFFFTLSGAPKLSVPASSERKP